MHSKIFNKFKKVESITDGISAFSFLGTKTDCRYKYGWKPQAPGNKTTPSYPSASEWTADWIACLLAAYFADENLRVIELGAGYAQWCVVTAFAYKQLCVDGEVSITALEADQDHFKWMQEHVYTNTKQLAGVKEYLLNAAAGVDGEVSFPILEEPSKTYGASYVNKRHEKSRKTTNHWFLNLCRAILSRPRQQYNQVVSMSLESIFDLDKNIECVDLLHIDIQGAEKELLESHRWKRDPIVKLILLGTHQSDDLHMDSRQHLENAGFEIVLDWAQNSAIAFNGESISTHDGALLACNPDILDIGMVNELIGI